MARLSCFIVALVALVAFVDAESAYCRQDLCQRAKGPHTMCIHPRSGPGPKCQGYVNKPLTSAEQKEIVDLHNKLRQKVASGQQPGQPAGVIPPLKWDPELAVVAQRWADQCEDGHDKCRNLASYSAGQNIAGGGSTGGFNRKVDDLVMMWFDEVEMFNPRHINPFVFSSATGHYTQLVWGETTHVGCGIVRHNKTIRGTTYNWTTLICNYGPAGNMLGGVVYKTR